MAHKFEKAKNALGEVCEKCMTRKLWNDRFGYYYYNASISSDRLYVMPECRTQKP